MILDLLNILTGEVRHDIEATQANTYISLAKESRGKGYKSFLIQHTSNKLFVFVSCRITEIYTYAKENNQVSYKSFIKTGIKIEKSS
jgi:hypothetical protein